MKSLISIILDQQLRRENFIAAQQLKIPFNIKKYHEKLTNLQKKESKDLKEWQQYRETSFLSVKPTCAFVSPPVFAVVAAWMNTLI